MANPLAGAGPRVRIRFPPAESPSLCRSCCRGSGTPAFRAAVRWLGELAIAETCHSYTGIKRFCGTAWRARPRLPRHGNTETAVGNPSGFERVGGLLGRKMADGE